MTFSLLSVAIALIIGAFVLSGALKGSRKGFTSTAISLAVSFATLFLAIIIARLVSDPLSNYVGRLVDRMGILDSLLSYFPSISDIILIAVDSIITPILFMVLYLALRPAVNALTSLVVKKALARLPYESGENRSDDAPIHVKYSKQLGIVTGMVCGLFGAMVIISPLFGTLRTANNVISLVAGDNAAIKVSGADFSKLEQLDKYGRDVSCLALDELGGKHIYNSLACSSYEDETVYFAKEIDSMKNVLSNFEDVQSSLTDFQSLDKDSIDTIRDTMGEIEKSLTFRMIAADFMSGAATNWLDDEAYMGIERPNFGALGGSLVYEIVYVLSTCEQDNVCGDVNTVLNILDILSDSQILSESNYQTMLTNIEENDTLDAVCAELQKNPRMAHITAAVYQMALKATASAIDLSLLGDDYDALMENMADTWNTISRKSYDYQVEYITRNAQEYAAEYGVEIPESAAQITAQAIAEWFADDDEITASDIDYFINYYASSNGY